MIFPSSLPLIVTGSEDGGACPPDDGCGGRWPVQGNYFAGVAIAFLAGSSVDSDQYIVYGLTHSMVRSWNADCNGGEYYVYIGDGTIWFYESFGALPSLLDDVELPTWRRDLNYYMIDIPCNFWYPPAVYTPTVWNNIGSASPSYPPSRCEWHQWMSCCSESPSDPPNFSLEHVYEDCGAKFRIPCGAGGTFPGIPYIYENYLRADHFHYHARITPYYSPAARCCNHGSACWVGEDWRNTVVVNDDIDSLGPCCMTATFSGLTLPERANCYFGPMESFPDLDRATVNYRLAAPSVWTARPWGCLGPFPTTCTVTGTTDGCTSTYTITLYGQDTVLSEWYEIPRQVVFTKSISYPRSNSGPGAAPGYELAWKLMPDQFTELFSNVPFDPAASFNLDIGYSIDFSNATATFHLRDDMAWGDCTNGVVANPFEDVAKWELRFTPVDRRVLYFDEEYWTVNGSTGCKDGPNQVRYIIPIVAGANWQMNDSFNYPTSWQFTGNAHARGSVTVSKTPADGDSVTISDGDTEITFEFDEGTAATGSITFSDNPEGGNYVGLNDGRKTPITFEFDPGIAATGTVTLSSNPADGDTVVISDGELWWCLSSTTIRLRSLVQRPYRLEPTATHRPQP